LRRLAPRLGLPFADLIWSKGAQGLPFLLSQFGNGLQRDIDA